jgi:hypothetical protein
MSGNNSFTGGVSIGGSRLILGHANALGSGALTSTNGYLSVLSNVTLANNLIVNGDINLLTDVRTVGNQTYNGRVIVANGTSTMIDILSVDNNKNIIISGTESAKVLSLNSSNGTIIFNGLVRAASNSSNDNFSLAVNAKNGVVINQSIGGGVAEIPTRGSYSDNRFGPNGSYLYDLKINTATGYEATNIAINADVITAGSQTYGSPVVVGDNGTNGFVRSLISLDPAITFKSTIDDSVVGVHTLIAKAIANDRNGPAPLVDYQNKVGSSKALNELQTITGIRAADDNTVGQANIDRTETNRLGTVFIRDDVSTVGNQTYLSDSAVVGRSGATDQVIRFTSNGGDVVFDLGSNTSSGIFAASSDLNAQFKLSGGSLVGQELFSSAGVGVEMIANPILSDINYLNDLKRLLSDQRNFASYDEMIVGEVDIGTMEDAGDAEKCDPKVTDSCVASL